MTRAWTAAEQRLSETRPAPKLADNATPEQIAAFRKEAGVPEKPENYSIELPGGKKFDESEAPTIENFLKAAHAQHWPQAEVTRALDAFHGMKQAGEERLVKIDNEARAKGEDVLRAEWGADYRRNVQEVSNLLAGMPEGLADLVLGGRLADGTRMGDHPGMIKWLSTMAMENPSLAPAGDAGPSRTDRLAEIRKIRQADPDKYDRDHALQLEERKLLEIELKRKPQQGRAA